MCHRYHNSGMAFIFLSLSKQKVTAIGSSCIEQCNMSRLHLDHSLFFVNT
uniref:Uncharacterized protein n=1 Tax=Zea mays TaxID=4577 RepID=C0PB76_MAIZE|nr:unknown [Zea mays]